MSLFLNTSSLHNNYLDCCAVNISETIEQDCLSVLHKLHDQVNGLQLVQVVVQPLARLFNPANLAALVANASPAPQTPGTTTPTINQGQSNATTPSSHHSSGSHNVDLDGVSASTVTTPNTLGSSSHNNTHSRGSSFVSGRNINSATDIGANNGSFLSTTSTYMMSPDTAQALIARLDTDRDINWLMEIIGYGLSMPFSLTGEQDSVKDCCTIYCEWLAAALMPYNENNEDSKYQRLSKLVPVPIRMEPNKYARKMLSHLYNVFLPRQPILMTSGNNKDQSDATLTAVSRQAVLCHRVLRTIESIAQNPHNLMDDLTWNHLLALLLTVNDKLLSAPTEPDDIGTQLHDRILGVLFELVLLASSRSIPSANLWKTFHEMCLNWRHRPALVDHWRRITQQLTKRIVAVSSSPPRAGDNESLNQHIKLTSSSNLSAVELSIANMTYENLSQTWYRFLNLIGNPVELSDPDLISRTDEFYSFVCAADNVMDPRQHPCLNVLPQIFMNSMSALRDYIETFLGQYEQAHTDRTPGELLTPDRHSTNNHSSRGSISSLSGYPLSQSTSSSIINTNPSANQQQQQQQHSQQQQQQHSQQQQQQTATTPILSRRTGIKSLALKTNKATVSTNTQISQPLDPSPIHEHPKSASISSNSRLQQQQFMQQRPSLTSLSSRTSQTEQQAQFKLYSDRPKCNSILHVFGDWLFSAALIGSELASEQVDQVNDGTTSEMATTSGSSLSTTATEKADSSRGPSPTSRRASNQTTSSQASILKSRQDSSSGNFSAERVTFETTLTPDSFESGQAEAMSILCRIFSSKSSSEDICPTYLSRFYLCLQHCLTCSSELDRDDSHTPVASHTIGPIKRQLLSSVLINSTTLLQKDLDGINLLIPSLIKAIEFVFECSEREGPIQPPPRNHNRSGSVRRGSVNNTSGGVTNHDLRRACILTLVNLLAYPRHFRDLVIRNCLNDSTPTTTFEVLRPRLLKLLFMALQTEIDPINMQILFGGLSLALHDLSSNSGKSTTQNSKTIRTRYDSMLSSSNNDEESSHGSAEHDDFNNQNSFVSNSPEGFLIKSLHVTCHLLINIWKHDTQVSLAALEVLTAIARVSTSPSFVESNQNSNTKPSYKMNNNNIEMKNEYMQTTKWICDYICNQCSRPPPAHSKDMHSTIVAAYQCLSVWIYNHPHLLEESQCVSNLIDVIELGVSGQKSKSIQFNPSTGNSTETNIAKGEKVMKPSSMRVREAAESLLNICMVTDVRTKNGNLILDTMINEVDLANLFAGSQYKTGAGMRQVQGDNDQRQFEAYKLFKYFADEDSNIIGLFENLNHDQNTKDSVLCLIRTPFGKHCWKFKFNYYTEKSREKIIANKTLGLIKRPFACTTPNIDNRMYPFNSGQNKSLYFNNTARYFPATLDNLPPNELDRLVSSLDDYVNDPRLKNDIDKIGRIFNHQVVAEQKVVSECSVRIKRVECEEPQALTELETARIIVTHLGLKTSLNSLTSVDRISDNFVDDLRVLDRQSIRTFDSVNIFYVRKNRTSAREILESVRARHNISLNFFEWLLELGQPTVVKNHSRWTGRVSNSWISRPTFGHHRDSDASQLMVNSQASRNQMLASDHGGAIFDGERMTLYWSDMGQELAFLVPHRIDKNVSNSIQIGDTNIIICWLECHDDIVNLPSDTLFAISETGLLVEEDHNNSGRSGNSPLSQQSEINKPKLRDHVRYVISPMRNGLYRVNLATSFGRKWLALPIVDGMTVSKAVLSGLIKESVLNLCRRRRLDADNYQPPHVKRRLRIQEICNSYKVSSRYEPTEFYYNLFRSRAN